MRGAALILTLAVAGCGSKPDAPKRTSPNPSVIPVTACAGIVPRIVAMSDFNPTRILSIAEPVTLSQTPTELNCRGSAQNNTNPDRYPIWFRQTIDASGTASVQYSDRPFPK